MDPGEKGKAVEYSTIYGRIDIYVQYRAIFPELLYTEVSANRADTSACDCTRLARYEIISISWIRDQSNVCDLQIYFPYL